MEMSAPVIAGDLLGTLVVLVGVVATAVAFVIAFRTTIRPGETASDHPKYSIFKDDR